MTNVESYPFLRIAKQFDVPYEDVLMTADALQHGIPHDRKYPTKAFRSDSEIGNEIVLACGVQIAIRDGEIDWKTGEAIDLLNPGLTVWVS